VCTLVKEDDALHQLTAVCFTYFHTVALWWQPLVNIIKLLQIEM